MLGWEAVIPPCRVNVIHSARTLKSHPGSRRLEANVRAKPPHFATIRLIPSAYLIAAKASTCNKKSGLDNCGVGTILLLGEGGPK